MGGETERRASFFCGRDWLGRGEEERRRGFFYCCLAYLVYGY
jgi:hypothetical protein